MARKYVPVRSPHLYYRVESLLPLRAVRDQYHVGSFRAVMLSSRNEDLTPRPFYDAIRPRYSTLVVPFARTPEEAMKRCLDDAAWHDCRAFFDFNFLFRGLMIRGEYVRNATY